MGVEDENRPIGTTYTNKASDMLKNVKKIIVWETYESG